MDEIPATLSIKPMVLVTWGRAGLLGLVAVLIGTTAPSPVAWLWWAALALTAATSLILPPHRLAGRLGRGAEVIVAGLAAGFATGAEATTITYIAAPVFAAGIFVGMGGVAQLVVLAAVVTVAAGLITEAAHATSYLVQTLQWLAVSSAVGLLGAWIRSLARSASVEPAYAQATRLLTQLRTIAKQLPGTLDPGSIADRLLDELGGAVEYHRAAVFTASGGGRLEVLAQRAPDRVAWETSVTADTPVGDVWASQQPQISARSLVRSTSRFRRGKPAVSSLVLPLVTGVRTVGLVAVEADKAHAYAPNDLLAAAEIAAPAALRLETALLFDEVRSIATTQERQRLAREIHDGVAQELVMVGYGIDNAIAASPPDSEAATQLNLLRSEVTRVITELRLSLFELRSDVDRHGGLGAAIAEYARAIGTSAGLRVHLSLDESTARLPAAVEAELLRIAQESITNARKHSGAANLWVSCEIDPPFARIEVVDDGSGIPSLGDRSDTSYGLSIMAERAERIRASFAISNVEPHGTKVSVALGRPTDRAATGSDPNEPADQTT